MRTETHTVRVGENMGPVDWSHPTAINMPQAWRDAEADPSAFVFDNGGFEPRPILSICMYDGWPYWTPRPAIHFIGPMNSGEWTFFDSYAVRPQSIPARGDA